MPSQIAREAEALTANESTVLDLKASSRGRHIVTMVCIKQIGTLDAANIRINERAKRYLKIMPSRIAREAEALTANESTVLDLQVSSRGRHIDTMMCVQPVNSIKSTNALGVKRFSITAGAARSRNTTQEGDMSK
jgi:hypothetical protein